MTSEISGSMRAPTVLKVLENIRDKIIMQELKHGDMLTENNLAADYNVSRGSVRSALVLLENEGLISTLSNGRRSVVGINEKFIDDLYETRIALEREAAFCCIKQPVLDLSPLAGALTKFYTLKTAPTEIVYLNRAIVNTYFHRAIFKTSGNRSLLQCCETIEPMMFALAKLNYKTLGDACDDDELVRTHTLILELISKKDVTVAEEITKHISLAKVESIAGMKIITAGAG